MAGEETCIWQRVHIFFAAKCLVILGSLKKGPIDPRKYTKVHTPAHNCAITPHYGTSFSLNSEMLAQKAGIEHT